ncbi:unnamed protein product [Calypogeia fissa]
MATRTLGVFSLLFFIVAGVLVSMALADGTGYIITSPAGQLPVVAKCKAALGAAQSCAGTTLTCPKQCQDRLPIGDSKKGCFIDCGTKCEATCKRFNPTCNGYGSMCYDPRLVGGDGSVFYFHGGKDQDFCLVSDPSVHINGHFIGLRPEGRKRDYTWVQALGVLFGSHKFSIGAKKVAQWDAMVDQLLFSYDGVSFAVSEEAGALWRSDDGLLRVERTYQRNVVEVVLDKTLSILIQVVPITATEDKVHNYQLPKDDVFAHLDMQFKFYNLSESVNGLLGQTYQPGYVSPAKVGVKMPILGGEDRFITTGLLNSDCKDSQFIPELLLLENVQTLLPFSSQCSSKGTGSRTGLVCRR